MPRLPKAQTLAATLSSELSGLASVVSSGATLPPEAHRRLLEATFIKAFTEFEWFLEELFFAILTGAARVDASGPKIRVRDSQLARAVARGHDRGYLTWLPIADTVDRAKRLLVDGQPFVRLTTRGNVRADLKRALAVRNATAHKSVDAQAKFQAATSNVFATAGDYLASNAGGQTACEAILANLHRYGQALVGTTAASMKLLGPEDPLRSNAKPGSGTYLCQS